MSSFVAVLLLASTTCVIAGNLLHPLSDEFIDEINAKNSTWVAGRNFLKHEYKIFEALASGSKGIKDKSKLNIIIHDEDVDIPDSFDAREAWPECADIIGFIQDQSLCGSCWAFAAAGAMSDRICIHSNGERKMLVSAQDILTCTCTLLCSCSGGFFDLAWVHWSEGYVTGGLYNNTSQGCKSYFLPGSDDHPNTDFVDTPSCVKQCDNSSLDYDQQKSYGQFPGIYLGETQIQLEIMKNGPVETQFIIFEDFASYKSGIYQHIAGSYVTVHAVRIIGWGVENGVKYWTIANSWNENWGENGFFRMIRGQNEGGLEIHTIAGLPDFKKF